MKVLLIALYKSSELDLREDFIPSSALVSLGASVREYGHEPVLMDLNNSVTHKQTDPNQYSLRKIFEAIRKEKPALIGFNCLFSGIFPTILEFVREIKKTFPDLPIATGGIHPTTFPQEILENTPEIDYIALGEGESQLLQLIESIDTDDLDSLSEINSFAYRDKDGDVKINRNQILLNYDEMPMPAWDMVKFEDFHMELGHFYNPKNLDLKTIIPIVSERGCPYRCNFCDMHVVMGRKLRRKNALSFVDELEVLSKEFGQNYFAFMDDNLTLDKKHILSICHEITKRNINIQFDTTGGLNINSLDEEIIEAMVGAGMVSATIAPEHGNEYIRNEVIGKMLPLHRIYEVVEIMKKYQVQIGSGWIMGFPEDTNETLQDSYDLMVDLKLDRNATGVAIPFPGTKLFDQVVRDDLFVEEFDPTQLWHTPTFATQMEFPIKPYNMTIDDLREWRVKFTELRYKFFGWSNDTFVLPLEGTHGRPVGHLLPRGAQPA